MKRGNWNNSGIFFFLFHLKTYGVMTLQPSRRDDSYEGSQHVFVKKFK